MESKIIEQYVAHLKKQGVKNPEMTEVERKAAKLAAATPEHILRLATVMAGIVERNKLKEG